MKKIFIVFLINLIVYFTGVANSNDLSLSNLEGVKELNKIDTSDLVGGKSLEEIDKDIKKKTDEIKKKLGKSTNQKKVSDDLNGKKIFCQIDKTPSKTGIVGAVNSEEAYFSFEFKSFSRVKIIHLNPYGGGEYFGDKSYFEDTLKYKTDANSIKIKDFNDFNLSIGRKNLKLFTFPEYVCDLASSDLDLESKMENLYEDLLKKAKKDNKI